MAMSIQELAKATGIVLPTMPKVNTNNQGFSELFNQAMNVLNDTNNTIKEADQLSLDFALGKVDSIHEVMIAQEKASVALQYTIQLRDKFLDAYNEIMRIQM